MKDIERQISALVENQFPAFYREEGPIFVEFLKQYYKWLEETNSVNNISRSLTNYRDIDKTLDEFLVYFKQKFLVNIQFETTTNKRLFVKRALDFYRSKGTERSVDLFFKLVYGEDSDVYYPSEDIFRLSDNEWVRPIYLEVTPSQYNSSFINEQIVGVNSGATAFVERLSRKRVGSKYIDVLFISPPDIDFETGEIIRLANQTVVAGLPTIIGSATTLDLVGGSLGFKVGDIVSFNANTALQGKARVSSVSDVTGVIDFTLADGGYGYFPNSEVIISSTVLGVGNVVASNTTLASSPFIQFETIKQPKASVGFNANTGVIANNTTVTFYYVSNNASAGTAKVLETTGNTFIVAPVSGDIKANTAAVDAILATDDIILGTTGNSVTANVMSVTDTSVTANTMGLSNSAVVTVSELTGLYEVDELVYQLDGDGNQRARGTVVGVLPVLSDVRVTLSNVYGIFDVGETLVGETSAHTGIISSTDTTVGVIDSNGVFTSVTGNYVEFLSSGTTGTILSVSTGAGATFQLGDFENEEAVSFFSDRLADINESNVVFYQVDIANSNYGFPKLPTANLTSIIGDALSEANGTIGSIVNIVAENPGSGYNVDPFVVVINDFIKGFDKRDYIVTYAPIAGSFAVGERVESVSDDLVPVITRGEIKSIINATAIAIKRLSLFDDFTPGSVITGVSSSASGTLLTVDPDLSAPPVGVNAIVGANVQSGTGAITGLEVIDSGFGYEDSQVVTGLSEDGQRAVTVKVNLGKQGKSEGYYTSQKSFLSADKYLQDGEYYQEYSYEILSRLPYNKYADIIKKALHVAGTRAFGSVVMSSNNNVALTDQSRVQDVAYTRTAILEYTSESSNTFAVGDNVLQSNTVVGVVAEAPSSVIVVADANNLFEVGATVTQGTTSGILKNKYSNTTHTTLYIANTVGGFDAGSNVEALSTHTIGIKHYQRAEFSSLISPVVSTGGFEPGRTVYQANVDSPTAVGIVGASTNSVVFIDPVSGSFQANSIIIEPVNGTRARLTNAISQPDKLNIANNDGTVVRYAQLRTSIGNVTGTFQVGEYVYQGVVVSQNQAVTNTFIAEVVSSNSTVLVLDKYTGHLANNQTITGVNTGATARVTGVLEQFGGTAKIATANSSEVVVYDTRVLDGVPFKVGASLVSTNTSGYIGVAVITSIANTNTNTAPVSAINTLYLNNISDTIVATTNAATQIVSQQTQSAANCVTVNVEIN